MVRPQSREPIVTNGYLKFGTEGKIVNVARPTLYFSEEIPEVKPLLDALKKDKESFTKVKEEIILVVYTCTQYPIYLRVSHVKYWVDDPDGPENDISFEFKGEWWYSAGDKLIRKTTVEGCIHQFQGQQATPEILEAKFFNFPKREEEQLQEQQKKESDSQTPVFITFGSKANKARRTGVVKKSDAA